ncbi:MAG: GIY-YIG nuclease family protein [Pirellulales bacterium]
MLTTILLFTTIVLTALCVVLLILLLEVKGTTWGVIERWREAFACRRQVANLRRELEDYYRQLVLARQATQPIVEKALQEAHEEVCREIGPANRHQLIHEFDQLLSFLASHGHGVTVERRRALFAAIESAYERARRIAEEKAKQAEIRAQMREEERVQKEAERAIREAEKEAQRKRQALEEAIRLLGDTHSEQIEKLRQELAEAQAKAERTKSMAQQTKVGYVYVISNIGSFGRGVFKVGLTRRLDPNERIYELSDASVPFSFDVHAMISSQDAPALEAVLHQELATYRVNKVNLRKEFFRVDLETIIQSVEKHHGQVTYRADAEALEYLESLEIEREQRGELPTLDQVEQVAGQPSVGSAVGTAST